MRKSSIKMKALSVMLTASLVTTSIQVFPVKAEKGEGVVRATRSFDSNYDNQNAYNGDDLGCTYTKEKTTFKVWTPEATKVVLYRYEKGDGGDPIEKVEMTKGDKGVWSTTITGDIVNTYYTYQVTVNGKTNKEAVDIYAKAAGVNGKRAMVVDLDSTDPDNWDKDYKREKTLLSDINVWEIHIRDFSIDVSSGVSEKNRGKYKAFTEKTTVNGEGRVASCVDYLKELGVTHVQLLPMYDYASVEETEVTNTLGSNYNWGYDPLNYNVPEGSYSSDPYDGNVRITEMKEMIQALHDAGIKVIMDVVYNHTYDTADSNFNKIAPDYYYKLNSDLTYNNQTGCGNATRSQAAMYRKFMIDSVSYWAGEYNLDGFRFDLMAVHDVTTMNQIRSTLDKKYGEDTIVLYGEGWAATEAESDGAWKGNEGQLDPGIGFFNDQIRDGLKGEHEFGKGTGFVQTNYTTSDYGKLGEKWPNSVFGGIMGSVGNWGGPYWMWRPFWSKSSNCTLSYTSAHDNLTLWDKLTENFGKQWDSTDERLLRMNKMAGAIVLVSKGGTFMQAGEEFARTKHGDHNSYRSPDSINKIDWTRLNTYENIRKYYEGMLEIRQVFSGFRSILTRKDGDNWNPQNNNINWIKKDEYGVSAFTETNNVSGEWNQIGVIINNSTSDATMSLGSGKWVVIADGDKAGLTKIAEYDGSSVKAAGKSVVVAVPKDTFDANPNVADLLRKNQTRNSAPVISGVEDQTVSVGEKVEFTVSAKDADGDSVTLAVKDLPKGAEFDAKTGKFSWDSAAEGEYTITFTANDGTDTATKTMKLIVTSPASALRTLIEEVEKAGLGEDNLCTATLEALNTALAAAKTVVEKDEPSETECSDAVKNLNTAYETARTEKGAYEDLKGTIKSVEDKIKNELGEAISDGYDKDAVEDVHAVIEDAKKLLENKGTKTAYYYAMEDLQDASDAVVSNLSTPQVHVSTSFTSPYIYVWTGTGTTATKIAGEWPGTALKDKDANGNYVFELPEDGTYNIIVNNGATSKQQTEDLEGLKGDITITVSDTSASTDANGNSIYKADTDCKPVSSGPKEVNKESLKAVIQAAKGLNQADYDAERFEAMKGVLTEAEETAEKTDITQVEVNQQARKLRSAMLALGAEEQGIIPTETPMVSAPPTSTPDLTTEEPQNTPEVTQTPNVEQSAAPIGSETPNITENPEQTTDPSQTDTPDTPVNTGTPNETKNPGGETAVPNITTTPNVTDTPGGNTDIKNTATPKPTATVKPQQSPTVTAVPSTVAVKKVTFNPGLTQVVKKAVKITMSAKGGSGDYLYNLEILDSKGNIVANVNGSKKNTYSWTPKKEGTYTVYVDIKDTKTGTTSKGKTCKYVVVKKQLTITQVKISKKKIVNKKSVAFTVTATGGKTKYQYAFTVKDAKGKVVKRVKYQSKKKLNWKPTKTGKYTVYVSVKDATKTVKTKKKTIKVVKK